MSGNAFTIIDDGRVIEVPATVVSGTVWVSAETASAALGWKVGPEDLRPDGVDLMAWALTRGRPIALDVEERAAYVGVPALERARALTSLQAPDFELPDLDGRLHRLSDHRGKKVLLVAYASW